MLWIMIKNNMKLMVRNKAIIALAVIAPIIVMLALSNAFDGLLQKDYEYEKMEIGYQTQEGSLLDDFIKNHKEQFAEQKLSLTSYEREVGNQMVQNEEISAFVVEESDWIAVYSLKEESISAAITRCILDEFYAEYGNAYRKAVFEQVAAAQNLEEKASVVNLHKEKLPSVKVPSAGNYYGIIEVIYFIWMGMLFLTAVVQSERSNRISQRFITSPVSSYTLFLSKFIPGVIFTAINTAIGLLGAQLIFGIEWNNLWGAIGILMITILGTSALGIACLYAFRNLAVSVIALFGVVWVLGFVGGSFETYMFSATPDWLKELSPMYYVNRSVVEFSTMGSSDYATGAILSMGIIFVVFSGLGSFLMKRRMEVE